MAIEGVGEETERDGEEEAKKVVGVEGVGKETERDGEEEGKNKVGVEEWGRRERERRERGSKGVARYLSLRNRLLFGYLI